MIVRVPKFKILLILIICVFLILLMRVLSISLLTSERRNKKIENRDPIIDLGGKKLPWYFSEGSELPTNAYNPIWPHQLRSDRIHEQLMVTAGSDSLTYKSIYASTREFDVPLGDSLFKDLMCPVSRCTFIKSRQKADAVLFKDKVHISRENVPQKQIWILYVLESPVYSGFDNSKHASINWTATYREDSEIVTPYEKWMYYDEKFKETNNLSNLVDYAAGKTKTVAWFVSNCLASNKRLEFAHELQQYIDVDIYGHCGELKCNRAIADCNDMLRKQYKFYLAFENSNCRDYITEKFFDNALRNDVVPVVMGAHPDDYKRVAPKYSYIHVDDFPSARDLADYLHYLNSNDDLYNAYFAWKGTGEFINTRFFCRLCALLHNPSPSKYYPNFRNWWAGADICRKDGWTK